MIALENFQEKIFKALRFYDIGFFALSLDKTRDFVLEKISSAIKPVAQEQPALTRKKVVSAMKKVRDSYYYLSNSFCIIAFSHFEIFLDQVLIEIFRSEPKLLYEFQKNKEFDVALEDELFFFHKKTYFGKARYFDKKFNIDWTKYVKSVSQINHLRNTFLHKGKVYAFTSKHISSVGFTLLKAGTDIAHAAGKKFEIKVV